MKFKRLTNFIFIISNYYFFFTFRFLLRTEINS